MKNIPKKRTEERERMMRFFFILLILFYSSPSFAEFRTVTINVNMQSPLSTTNCLKCHGSTIDGMKYANSVHGPNACSSCHVDIIDVEKHAKKSTYPQKYIVVLAMRRKQRNTQENVHRVKNHYDCTECHSDIHYLGKWGGSKVAIINKCTSCHSEQDYVESGHDKAILNGNQDSACCSDCHGLHNTKLFRVLGKGIFR